MHDYLRTFVVKHKIISYEYFMHRMREWEIHTLANMIDDVDYNEWRRMRILYYGIVSPYLKKPTTPNKLFPLPGDDDLEEHQIEMTNQERDTLRARSKMVRKKLFKKSTVDGKHS